MEEREIDCITKVDADVENLLSRIDLQHLSDKFKKEHITMSILAEMTSNDLKEIGVEAFGDRHTILKEVRKTNQTNEEQAATQSGEKSQESLCQDSDFLWFNPCSSNSQGKEEIRLILLGKTGVGKSATGNSLLGEKYFVSRLSGSSVTSKCNAKKADRFNKSILVIDTPGLFDTSSSEDDTIKEICRCVALTAPGPHAFLLVLNVTSRFTYEEKKATDRLLNIFGKNMHKYAIVVFTGKDKIDTSIENYIESCPGSLQSLIEKCGNRYIAVDNSAKGSENDQWVKTILSKVEENLKALETNYFTSDMFEKAERIIQEREKVILAKREDWMNDQIKLRKMKISEKYSAICEPLQTKMDKLHTEILDRKKKINLIMNKKMKSEEEEKIIQLQSEHEYIHNEIKRVNKEKVSEIEKAVKEKEEEYKNLNSLREVAREEAERDGSLMLTLMKILAKAIVKIFLYLNSIKY